MYIYVSAYIRTSAYDMCNWRRKRTMRREDIIVYTGGGYCDLYCSPAGEPRACVYMSYSKGDWRRVDMQHWSQKYYRVSIHELRGIKYLLWYYLRPITERAVLAYALPVVRDIARALAFTILRSNKEYQRVLAAVDSHALAR